jgi:hypothetical protein
MSEFFTKIKKEDILKIREALKVLFQTPAAEEIIFLSDSIGLDKVREAIKIIDKYFDDQNRSLPFMYIGAKKVKKGDYVRDRSNGKAVLVEYIESDQIIIDGKVFRPGDNLEALYGF